MRRAITLILCIAAAGVITNAIVICVIAASVNVIAPLPFAHVSGAGLVDGTEQAGGYFLDGVHWSVECATYFGSEIVTSTARVGENPGITEVSPAEAVPSWLHVPPPFYENMDDLNYRHDEYLAIGWPLLSASCQTWQFTQSSEQDSTSGLAGGFALPLPEWTTNYARTLPRTVPVRPLWRGTVVNSAFYGALLFLPFAPSCLRRELRRLRGQCLKCGYPGGDSPLCSECGRPLPV